ncbi:hypothetical protein KOM00_04040 [Geomonas sp. Red69]|uniref:hypothetical protein n=1 Tax=Geomonas diazotrophica TaxID=2843197 RepID=UPI001C124686|nr:hypothetical protein [Geomonas diazotrophica]MBU5635896.1 hypothetical protein [Geomonas diazotrophica]
MSKKPDMPLNKYLEQLRSYRFEFLKFDDEFISWSERHYPASCCSDELKRLLVISGFDRLLPRKNDVYCEASEPLEFTFKVHRYTTYEELKEDLEAFAKYVENEVKESLIKNNYAIRQRDYIRHKNGKINYFSANNNNSHFSKFKICLRTFELYKIYKNYTQVCKEMICEGMYSPIGEDSACSRRASVDYKMAVELIQCSRTEWFPFPAPTTEILEKIKQDTPRFVVPLHVQQAFQRHMQDPINRKKAQEALSILKERNSRDK